MAAVNGYRSTGQAIVEAETVAPGWLAGSVHEAIHPGLTPRERDVFEMVGLALTNREIASRLCLSEKTVKRHVTVVMRKLGARNRVEAALIAERQHHPEPGTP